MYKCVCDREKETERPHTGLRERQADTEQQKGSHSACPFPAPRTSFESRQGDG